jgi:benzaldehyde dehydrogenase (NAD)
MSTHNDPQEWSERIFIDGSFVRPASGQTIEVLEKATGKTLGTVGAASEADVDNAVRSSVDAAAAWAATPPHERAAIMRRAAVLFEERTELFVDCIVRETGAIAGKAHYEVSAAAGYVNEAAALATRAPGELLASAVPGRRNLLVREPVGVVGVITPWNFPLVLSVYVLAPAIALGNTVVLKPASNTPISGGALIAQVFRDAGLPDGVFNVVPGPGATGEALVRHDDVDMIHFTGSTAVGTRINQLAATSLKRVSLEMGGNNGLVILDDADIDAASSIGAWSSFHYQGQTCITASRQIVMRDVADAYIEALAAQARAIAVGDPATAAVGMGPMIDERQRDRAHQFLTDSVAMGATVVEGGTFDGLFYRPTVVTNVTREMPLYFEEIFGPIAPIVIAENEADALCLVNDTPYGLVNAVLTGDPWRGLAFAEKVHSGMVHVNDTTVLSETTVPFGGTGASGVGWPTGGDSNIDQFTEPKWISVRADMATYPYLSS